MTTTTQAPTAHLDAPKSLMAELARLRAIEAAAKAVAESNGLSEDAIVELKRALAAEAGPRKRLTL